MSSASFLDTTNRKMIFVHGKGGVGKTTLAKSIARFHESQEKKTLWVLIEDPTYPKASKETISPYLERANVDSFEAFKEYIALKLHSKRLTDLFVNNRVIEYMARAAPGLPALVTLGKIWHERDHYDHIVIDMPSTGYGVMMFHAVRNFSRLFRGGKLDKDAIDIFGYVQDRRSTGHIIVALPEEMPIQESLEMKRLLGDLFPENEPSFVVNKRSSIQPKAPLDSPSNWTSPVPDNAIDFIAKRSVLEVVNLQPFEQAGLQYLSLLHVPPVGGELRETQIIDSVVQTIQDLAVPKDSSKTAQPGEAQNV